MIRTNAAAEDLAIRIVLANTAFNPIITGVFNKTYRQGLWFFTRTMCHALTLGLIDKPAGNYLKSLGYCEYIWTMTK